MASQWLIARNGTEIGKASSAELKEMARTGTLLPIDHVWREGMSQCHLAERVPNLFSTTPGLRAGGRNMPTESRQEFAGPFLGQGSHYGGQSPRSRHVR